MKYLQFIWSCLREVSVALPAAVAVSFALSANWMVASAFLLTSLAGFRRSLDVREVKAAEAIRKLTGDFEYVRIERNDPAFPNRLAIYTGKPKRKGTEECLT